MLGRRPYIGSNRK